MIFLRSQIDSGHPRPRSPPLQVHPLSPGPCTLLHSKLLFLRVPSFLLCRTAPSWTRSSLWAFSYCPFRSVSGRGSCCGTSVYFWSRCRHIEVKMVAPGGPGGLSPAWQVTKLPESDHLNLARSLSRIHATFALELFTTAVFGRSSSSSGSARRASTSHLFCHRTLWARS